MNFPQVCGRIGPWTTCGTRHKPENFACNFRCSTMFVQCGCPTVKPADHRLTTVVLQFNAGLGLGQPGIVQVHGAGGSGKSEVCSWENVQVVGECASAPCGGCDAHPHLIWYSSSPFMLCSSASFLASAAGWRVAQCTLILVRRALAFVFFS